MPTHDIIDNRSEKLVDHIKRILDSSGVTRFEEHKGSRLHFYKAHTPVETIRAIIRRE